MKYYFKLYIVIIIQLLSFGLNAQVRIGFTHPVNYTNIYDEHFLIPSFVKKNKRWEIDTAIFPKKTWYIFSDKLIDSIADFEQKRLEGYRENSFFALQKENNKNVKYKNGNYIDCENDSACFKPLLITTNKKSKLITASFLHDSAKVKQQLVQYFKNLSRSGIKKYDSSYNFSILNVFPLSKTNTIIVANCNFDLIKLIESHKKDYKPENTEEYISQYGSITGMFVLNNNKLSTLLYRPCVISAGDFDNDGYNEIFIWKMYETKNEVFLYTSKDRKLITNFFGGN